MNKELGRAYMRAEAACELYGNRADEDRSAAKEPADKAFHKGRASAASDLRASIANLSPIAASAMIDVTARRDDIASQMRDYYEANKPIRWWQRRRISGDCRADALMLGLLCVAEEGLQGDAQTSPPKDL